MVSRQAWRDCGGLSARRSHVFTIPAMNQESIAVRFGIRVRSLRLAKNISLEAFAARCGLQRTCIGSIERGEKTVTIETAAKLAVALGLPLHQLMVDL